MRFKRHYLLATLLWALAGCSQDYYRSQVDRADRDAYQILEQKALEARKNLQGFSLQSPSRPPATLTADEILQERMSSGTLLLTPQEALHRGRQLSREYLGRKDQLFLTALTLTEDRHAFESIWSNSSEGHLTRNKDFNQRDAATSHAQVGVEQLMAAGGKVGLNLTNDLLHYFSGHSDQSAISVVSLNLSQPLLRGAGSKIVQEQLKQSERNVIYAIRDFSYYQNSFAVQTLTSYLRVLQNRKVVFNEYGNYLNLRVARERAEALAADRLPQYQVDQTLQDELRARIRYQSAVDTYRSSVDQFKNYLGLPQGLDLNFRDDLLADLESHGLPSVALSEDEAVSMAVERRPDLLNEIDKLEDMQRRIEVAANAFLPRVDLVGGASLQSKTPTNYAHFNARNYQADVGLRLNLPLDPIIERNDYRQALIQWQAQIRQLALVVDTVQLDIRQFMRAMSLAQQNYFNQQLAVELAKRRVDAAGLLLQAGRAQVRDLLDAQSSLVSAQNALATALIDYYVARVQLLRSVGILQTDRESFWTQAVSESVRAEPTTQPTTSQGDLPPLITPEQVLEGR